MDHVILALLHENMWWSGGESPCNLNQQYKGEWSAPHLNCFILWKYATCTHSIGNLVGPRAWPNVMDTGIFSSPAEN
jgi:hypothetical protein